MKLNRVYSFLLFISTLTACTQKQQENKAELSAPTVKIDHPKDTTPVSVQLGYVWSKDTTKIHRWFEPATLDTLIHFSSKISVRLIPTDSVYFDDYFINAKARDSIKRSNGENNYSAISRGVAEYLLRKNRAIVKKESNGLFLKLKNGDWKSLSLGDDTEDSEEHVFEHYFKEFGYFSVEVLLFEGMGYKLISDKDGKETYAFGRPYFSPNGKFVICINADIYSGFSTNGFQLFRNSNGQLELLGFMEPEGWGPTSVKWIDNNNLLIKNTTVEWKGDHSRDIFFYSKMQIIENIPQ